MDWIISTSNKFLNAAVSVAVVKSEATTGESLFRDNCLRSWNSVLMKYKYLPIQLTEFYFIGITTLNAIVTCLSSNMFLWKSKV